MEKKHAGGRPTKYNAQYHPILIFALAESGKTEEEMAARLGIVTATFSNWKKIHPEFLDALRRGKDDPDSQMAATLFNRGIGYKLMKKAFNKSGELIEYEEQMPPDVKAQIFWLTNRRRDLWRNNSDNIITGSVTVDDVTKLTAEERAARIAVLKNELGSK